MGPSFFFIFLSPIFISVKFGVNIVSSRKTIDRIRSLVDNLSDRDIQLKSDSMLFEDFFKNFPIPVTMWSLDTDGNVISKRGNTVIHEEGTCLGNMFHDEYSADFKEAHAKAYQGNNVGFFSSLSSKTYYTRLVPRYNEKQDIIGLTGISWDITSNFTILECLREIRDISDANSKVHQLAELALSSSRIKSLLSEGKTEDGK